MAEEKLILNKHVVLNLRARTKDGAIREMCGILGDHSSVKDAKRLLQDVMRRENQESTYVGNNVAIPHAMSPGVTGIRVGFGRSIKGIPIRTRGKETKIHFVVLIVFSAQQVNNYLRVLSYLSTHLHDRSTRKRLLECETGQDILAILTP
ncbi:MAG: PTS sugar transporter subunit IIA [Candidatus Omnitrophica bacterium]|nr:PTS sugar transporter subunit IIA [Candidatus Omnitrophota bacterium]